ncbi:MAG: hypothetical protein ABJB47_23480 [Actinomycetota bacterium]
MTAEISAAPPQARPVRSQPGTGRRSQPGIARRRPDGKIRPVVGVLADGTAFYAPIGEVVTDGAVVTCHLCGRSFRSVTAHLRAHGWAKAGYCDAFGLERGQSLEGQETRKLRSASFSARMIFDPAIREGSAAGRERGRRGELTRDAVRAAAGWTWQAISAESGQPPTWLRRQAAAV